MRALRAQLLHQALKAESCDRWNLQCLLPPDAGPDRLPARLVLQQHELRRLLHRRLDVKLLLKLIQQKQPLHLPPPALHLPVRVASLS